MKKKLPAALLCACALLGACRTQRPAPAAAVVQYRADTIYTAAKDAAALLVRDSIAADTAGRVTYRERIIYRERVRTDTLRRHTADTVRITAPAPPAKEPGGGGARPWPWLIAGAAIGAAAALRLARR